MEIGVIQKGWKGRTHIGIVYPNDYYIGMSNLAIHALYDLINADETIVAERIFLDSNGSIESKRRLHEFDLILFSFSFETDYLNIPALLRGETPLLRKERSKTPVLMAGGAAVTLNPYALSEIFDCIAVGEAECMIEEIKAAAREGSRDDILRRLAQHPSIIVPDIKEGYKERAWARDIDTIPISTVIWSEKTEFGHMHLVEASRGCPFRCRFCATPCIYSPYRARGREALEKAIARGLKVRRQIGIIGSDILRHGEYIELASSLAREGIGVSFSSIRVDGITRETAHLIAECGQNRIALGIEAGREEMRYKIGKRISNEKILEAVRNLAEEGITRLKLYFMIGLPEEDEEDIAEIARLSVTIREWVLKYRRSSEMVPEISVVATPFVPKKGTPLEDAPFCSMSTLKKKLSFLRHLVAKIGGVTISGEAPKKAYLEYLLSNGRPDEIVKILEKGGYEKDAS